MVRKLKPLGLVVGLAFGVSARSAMAEPSATELAVARKLFEDAVRFERESRWELAASKLNDALTVKDTPGLRFHLAHCEDRLGHLVEAMIHYDHARELIASGVKAPDVEELLEPARASLELRLPTLMLVVPEVGGLEVELDGRQLARSVLGRAAPVNPGVHKILVRAPTYAEYVEEVSILEGERRRISVQLEPLAKAQPSATGQPGVGGASKPARTPSSATSTRSVVLVSEAAFTLAALGVGVGFTIAKSGAADRVRRAQDAVDEAAIASGSSKTACNSISEQSSAVTQACSELDDAKSRYDLNRKLGAYGLIGASVGAAATLATLALWPSSPAAPQVAVSSSSAFVGLSGRF
ncbi:MAG: hypothetical protein QM756_18355 [Polyangiaceae bacterium]